MNQNLIKSSLPHIVSVFLFVLVSVIYFYPGFTGKQVKQTDMMNHTGMAKEVVDYRNKTGEEPLWTNSMFGGMPAYQISITYSGNLLKNVTEVTGKLLTSPGATIFLALLSFYILLIVLGVPAYLALTGAIAYGFSSYLFIIIEAGHVTKGFAIAYMPMVVAGILLCYRNKIWAGGILTAFGLSLELSANHLQITYYLLLTMIIFVIIKFIEALKNKSFSSFLKSSIVIAIASILAIGPNITNIWATYEYGKYTTRGKSELTNDQHLKTSGLDKDYATQWSYGISETFTLMVPNFKGGSSGAIGTYHKSSLDEVDPNYRQYISQMDSYWGEQPFTSGPVYVGAIICFLFILGMLILKGTLRWWLLIATILSFLLAWGKNFMFLTSFFLDHFPAYNKFRAVSMILTIAQFTMPLGAILCVYEIVKKPTILKEKRKEFFIALGSTAGLCLLFLIMPSFFNSFFKVGEYNQILSQLKQAQFPDEQAMVFLGDIENARKAIFSADVLRSLVLILLAFMLIWLFSKSKIKDNMLFLSLGALILIDMWSVDKRYLNKKSYVTKSEMEVPFVASSADLAILKDTSNYRVLNISVSTFNDASTSYFHKSIGGYHGAKLKRYQELIDRYISPGLNDIVSTLKNSPTDSSIQSTFSNLQVLNMLNTRYIIYNPDASPLINKSAYGNAWFIDSIKLVGNADQEIAEIGKANLYKTAVIDKRYADILGSVEINKSPGKIMLKSYTPNNLVYESESSTDKVAVFSEIHYDKGWNAFIDGNVAEYVRADYVLRAMKIPAGKHKIEFKFEPTVYKTGETISLITSLIILGLLIFVIVGSVKKQNHVNS